jgi:hypothetical protein
MLRLANMLPGRIGVLIGHHMEAWRGRLRGFR